MRGIQLDIFDVVDDVRQTTKKVNDVRRTREEWIQLGVDFELESKERLMNMRIFADENELVYHTFRRNVARYKLEINKRVRNELLNRSKKFGISNSSHDNKINKKLILLDQFRESTKNIPSTNARSKSMKWFEETARGIIKGNFTASQNLHVGRLYTYAYDPKTKEKLPYWDRFPLIIFLDYRYARTTGNMYFQGLNLHYISPRGRQEFLEELLYKYSSTETLGQNTRLNINWNAVKSMRGSTSMIKNYLPNHIRSGIKEIDPSQWGQVIHLPLQKFISDGRNYSAMSVYGQSGR